MLAWAAWARQRHQRKLEQCKREALKRTPFAILDELPPYHDLSLEHRLKARRSKKRASVDCFGQSCQLVRHPSTRTRFPRLIDLELRVAPRAGEMSGIFDSKPMSV